MEENLQTRHRLLSIVAAFVLLAAVTIRTHAEVSEVSVAQIKDKPGSWKEMFFPEIHNLPGD